MAENVIKLQEKLEAMSTPHCKTNKTNLWDVAVSVNRTNAVPLDKSSIIFEDNATETIDGVQVTAIDKAAAKATAYPGQIISGLKETDGKVYVLQPTGHKHNTHTAEAIDAEANEVLIYKDQTQSEGRVYEELAPLSTVEYKVNKEAYERQVANNARKNTETKLANFITQLNTPAENGSLIGEDGSLTLNLPDTLSDNSKNTTKTVLDYIVETVKAEVQKRYAQDLVLLGCINNLDLQRAISVEETTQDGILALNLETKLRDSSSDIVNAEKDSENTPLRKYNN
jgi:hypothetical protein